MKPHTLDSGMWFVKEPGRPSLFGPIRAGRSWVICRECGWESEPFLGDGARAAADDHACPVVFALRYFRAASRGDLGDRAALAYLLPRVGVQVAEKALLLWWEERHA